MTDSSDLLHAYVRAALELQGYAFSEPDITEIVLQFTRIEAIARTILPTADAQADLGPAAVFRP